MRHCPTRMASGIRVLCTRARDSDIAQTRLQRLRRIERCRIVANPFGQMVAAQGDGAATRARAWPAQLVCETKHLDEGLEMANIFGFHVLRRRPQILLHVREHHPLLPSKILVAVVPVLRHLYLEALAPESFFERGDAENLLVSELNWAELVPKHEPLVPHPIPKAKFAVGNRGQMEDVFVAVESVE